MIFYNNQITFYTSRYYLVIFSNIYIHICIDFYCTYCTFLCTFVYIHFITREINKNNSINKEKNKTNRMEKKTINPECSLIRSLNGIVSLLFPLFLVQQLT